MKSPASTRGTGSARVTSSSRWRGPLAGGAAEPPEAFDAPPAPSGRGALRNITREMLEPLWLRSKLTTDEIGVRLGVTGAAIRWKAKALGLPPRGRASQRMSCPDEFRRLWLAGVRATDMAEHFGYAHKSCVSQRALQLGLPKRRRVRGVGVKSGTGRNGWANTITIAQYREAQLGERMRSAA